MTDDEPNYSVPLFLTEVLKADGTEYPPATLRILVLALQKHLEINDRKVQFLHDDNFCVIRDTLDDLMKQRARQGLGMAKKQAEIITAEMEEKMWNLGILGDTDPPTLLHTMLYEFGLHFALRGRDDHRRLRPSQLTIRTTHDGRRYVEYWEDVSKARSGGLQSFRRPIKVTQAFELLDCPQRCPVRLYELYTARYPPDRPEDAFYLRPLDKFTEDRWFSTAPNGVNTLGSIISNLCKRACFVGDYTNHSLRATEATRLFDAKFDDQLIKLKTGHSSDAVRSYKRVSDEQLGSMSDVIATKPPAHDSTPPPPCVEVG